MKTTSVPKLTINGKIVWLSYKLTKKSMGLSMAYSDLAREVEQYIWH